MQNWYSFFRMSLATVDVYQKQFYWSHLEENRSMKITLGAWFAYRSRTGWNEERICFDSILRTVIMCYKTHKQKPFHHTRYTQRTSKNETTVCCQYNIQIVALYFKPIYDSIKCLIGASDGYSGARSVVVGGGFFSTATSVCPSVIHRYRFDFHLAKLCVACLLHFGCN